MKEMSRKNKSRNRKQDKKSSKIRSLKKYQIQQTPRKRVESLVDCLHLPTDVVMGREISLLSGNSQMQIRNFKKLLVCKEDEICLLAGRHQIKITGRCLTISYFATEEVLITGNIQSICYEE